MIFWAVGCKENANLMPIIPDSSNSVTGTDGDSKEDSSDSSTETENDESSKNEDDSVKNDSSSNENDNKPSNESDGWTGFY